MSLVLRLDIDKPYGRTTLSEKVKSKLREDFYYPALPGSGYLADLILFLRELNLMKIPAISYHRICTAPSPEVVSLLREGGHGFGLHAEDTRSLKRLQREVEWLRRLAPLPLHSFTKHGSGELKLGRRHYAPYEPEKYRAWAVQLGLPYLYGNGIAESAASFHRWSDFSPDMFWLEPGYQSPAFASVEDALRVAETETLVVIIHPENLRAIPAVGTRFRELVAGARARGLEFLTPSQVLALRERPPA